MPFYLDLTLQQRATLSLAISIWNHQKAKNKISEWSDNPQKLLFEERRCKWKQLIKEVLKEVNKDLLPPPFRGELFYVVEVLGEKIYCWYRYICFLYYDVYDLDGDVTNYIGEIYWTPIGTIDEVRILQSYWLKNPNLNVPLVYDIACKNALKENIDDLWQKIPNSIKVCYDESNMHYDYPFENPFYDPLVLVYWKLCRDGQLDEFPNFVLENPIGGRNNAMFEYNSDYSLNQNMFLLSVFKGYNNAVKYFWKKLTQEEKDSSILYSAYISVVFSLAVSLSTDIGDYMKEKHLEICIFSINQMTMNQKESFLRSKSISDEVNYLNIRGIVVSEDILPMLLTIWPWQELFTPVLNNMLQYPEDNTKLVSRLLSSISWEILEPRYAVENNKLRSMLREVWFKIPRSIKHVMIQNIHDDSNYNFMDYLLQVEDLDSIKMIFNDPEIADIRMQTIKFGRTGYELMMKSNEYELLNQFMEKVLRSEKEKINSNSSIDYIRMCQAYVNIGKYDSADKFLTEKFETIEERRQCKDRLKNYEFFINWVFTRMVWCKGSVDKAKEETSRFLEWLLESKDDIECLKKDFIVNSEPLNGKILFWDKMILILSEEQAQKIRQILA